LRRPRCIACVSKAGLATDPIKKKGINGAMRHNWVHFLAELVSSLVLGMNKLLRLGSGWARERKIRGERGRESFCLCDTMSHAGFENSPNEAVLANDVSRGVTEEGRGGGKPKQVLQVCDMAKDQADERIAE